MGRGEGGERELVVGGGPQEVTRGEGRIGGSSGLCSAAGTAANCWEAEQQMQGEQHAPAERRRD